jgi:hypothetical protein
VTTSTDCWCPFDRLTDDWLAESDVAVEFAASVDGAAEAAAAAAVVDVAGGYAVAAAGAVLVVGVADDTEDDGRYYGIGYCFAESDGAEVVDYIPCFPTAQRGLSPPLHSLSG